MLSELGSQILSFTFDIALTVFLLCVAAITVSFTFKVTMGLLIEAHKRLKKFNDY